MKKQGMILLIAGLLVLIIFLIFCNSWIKNMVQTKIPIPRYESKETYYSEGFQDYTDYCKFFYKEDSTSKFEGSTYFRKVTQNDIEEIKGYIEDFNKFVVYAEYYDKYDFDILQIEVGDYFYIYNKGNNSTEYSKYNSYDVFYYDTNKHTLYMFHNNT